MKKDKLGLNILVWTFVVFFSLAWGLIKLEEAYFPPKIESICTV